MPLVSLTEAVSSTLDGERFDFDIFLDFAKSLGTLSHKTFLSKLEHSGVCVCALEWFRFYLSSKRQYVSANGSNSYLMPISCGVPQSYVIGPLLFVININDLPHASKKLDFYLFTDDTNIYSELKDLSSLIIIAGKELRSIKRWLIANKLWLNIDKTNGIIFESSSIDDAPNIVIKVGKVINRVKVVTFLGLLLDEHLS